MSSPLPPRFSNFADPLGDVVWAAVSALSPAEQQVLYQRLRDHLGDEFLAENSVSARIHRATDGLRRAAELLGHSPSINEYRKLRLAHPEEQLPPDGSVRSALGSGSWNHALAAARLDSVTDGDVMGVNLGTRLTEAECLAAVCACAKELGMVPSATMYRSWAARSEVRRRPGRRPLTITPMVLRFGNFGGALAAAGLIRDPSSAMTLANGVVRMGTGRVTDDQIGAALQEVCDRVGHVPRSNAYGLAREQIIRESAAAGDPRTIPSVATLIYRYGSWNGALEKFGMDPFDARADVKPFTPPAFNKRLVVFSEEEMLAAIREAAASVKKGAKLGMQDYVIWRKAEIDRSMRETETARRLPAPETIRRYLGSWLRARKLAFEQTD
ncbi:MAG: Homing endonuclease associated repeat [Gaiellaceae bacterium]|nr:Homing endonuclease associated repeat [Gaiellaceae bacterium]